LNESPNGIKARIDKTAFIQLAPLIPLRQTRDNAPFKHALDWQPDRSKSLTWAARSAALLGDGSVRPKSGQ
jgi:hypothetical protein